MSRRSTIVGDIRMSIGVVERQDIMMSYMSRDIKLETFSPFLHLPPAELVCKNLHSSKCYSGLPMFLVVSVTNCKPVKIQKASVKIKGKQDKKVIFKHESPPTDIAPHETMNVQINFIPQTETIIRIEANLVYYVENSKYSYDDKASIQVLPMATIKYSLLPNPKMIQVFIKNLYTKPISNISLLTDGGDQYKIPISISPQNEYADIMTLTRPHTNLMLSFATSSSRNVVNYTHFPNTKDEKAEIPIKLIINNVPNEIPVMKTFNCTLELTNLTQTAISGRLQVAELNDSIIAHGNNDLSFTNVQPNKSISIPIEFVALKQGTYCLPSFDCFYNDSKHTRIKTDNGCIVLGNAI